MLDPPRESQVQTKHAGGPLLLDPTHIPPSRGNFLLTALFDSDCILPGWLFVFVSAPVRVQGLEGEAGVYVSSYPYFPKWYGVGAESTAPGSDCPCSKSSLRLIIDRELWTNDLGSPCLGFY